MDDYVLTVTELVQRTVAVEADSKSDARRKVLSGYGEYTNTDTVDGTKRVSECRLDDTTTPTQENE